MEEDKQRAPTNSISIGCYLVFKPEFLVTLVSAIVDGEVLVSSAVAAAGSVILSINIVPIVAATRSLYISIVAAPIPLSTSDPL